MFKGNKKLHISILMFIVLGLFTSCFKTSEEQNISDIQLYNGIINNDFDMVKLAIDNGADLEYLGGLPLQHSIKYNNALAIAVDNKNEEMVSFLLENGADPNRPLEWGTTILTYAALNNMYGITETLINNDADINKRDFINKRNALDYAMAEIHYENEAISMFELLKNNGAEITDKTLACAFTCGYGDLTLEDIYAQQSPHYKKIQLVYSALNNKSNINLPPALKHSILGNSNKMIENLNSNISNEELNLITFFTAAFGTKEAIDTLLNDYNVDKNILDKCGNNLAVISATYNNLEMLKHLINLGVDVSFPNHQYEKQRMSQNNALVLAIRNQSYDTTRYILENKYISPQHSSNGENGIYRNGAEIDEIATNCDVISLKILIDNGFILNEADKNALIIKGEIDSSNRRLRDEYKNLVEYVNKY